MLIMFYVMEACHILLGRPWQFDKQTIHDGLKPMIKNRLSP